MPQSADRPALRLVAGCSVVAVYVAAAAVLAATGIARIRYSADHDRTIAVWEVWIPVAAALLVARLVPPRLPAQEPEPAADRPQREAWSCVAIAAAFAVAVIIFESAYIVLKIGLIGIAPTLVLTNRAWLTGFPQRRAYGKWWWLGPVAGAMAWFALAWGVGPFARPATSDATIVTLVSGFVLNAYLEERFYRGWLQTRLEHLCGRWTAIGAASLLWAAWHLAIHSTHRPVVDVAAVVAHLGVLGLLLGYLWSRFRNPYPLLAVHAAINTPLDLLTTAWT